MTKFDQELVLEFLTPDSTIIKRDILMISLETSKGQISVLKYHKNLITTLSPGKIVITHHNHTTESYMILEGILIVKNFKLIVITDILLANSQKDFNSILQQISKLEDSINSSQLTDQEQLIVQNEISKYFSLKNYFITYDY